MFYTLADYKDILDGKNIVADILNGSSGSDKDMVEREKTIKEKIKIFFEQNGNKEAAPRGSPQTQHSVEKTTRESLWDKIAEHVWKGMICALSYNTENITKDEDVHTKLMGATKTIYKYNTVTISSVPSGDITLDDFASRPTFFRWLEEWADEFCRKRTHKLAQIKHECRSDKPGHQYCSGDGHDCTNNDRNYNNMFADLFCRPCYEQCRKYKNWIDMKFEEFHKQEKKYEEEHGKVIACSKNGGDDDNTKFCQQIKEKKTAADFLAALKHCKDGQGGEEKKSNDQDNKINFNDPKTTFGPLDYCKTCPFNGVNCNGSGRGRSNGCNVNGNGETWEKVFGTISENGENTTEITVEMIDRRASFIKKYLENSQKLQKSKDSNDLFKTSKLFKGIRKQEWECRFKEEKIDVCKLTNFNNEIDLNPYTTFKVLLHYWLEDFLYGYYILKKKRIIDLCTKNGGNTCDKEPKIDCVCVKTWVEKKKEEWEKIKNHFKNRNQKDGDNIMSKVKNFLEELIPRMDLVNGKGKINELKEFLMSYGCNGTDSSQKDIIQCLLNNLQNEIKTCETQSNCDTLPPSVENLTIVEDIDPDDQDTQIDIVPGVCNTVVKPTPPEPPMTCVERIAKELRVEAEENAKKYDSTLIGVGKNFNGGCNKVKKNNVAANGEDSCKFEQTYKTSLESLNETCKGNGKERFKIGNIWKCEYIKDIGQNLCIPPRRKAMCIKHLKNITTRNVTNSTELLQKIQEVAKNEGDDIIKKLLPKYACNENVICDAMKYSFADLGDIIRGRDIFRNDRDQVRIQTKLKNVFTKIYYNLDPSKKKEYQNDITYLYKLRSDWWDANRKHIWKAMTCNAPKDAKLNIKLQESYISIGSNSCGYDNDPTNYDYIPQRFRWMQEWSEYYCKALTDEIKKLNEGCKECTITGLSCQNDEDGTKCKSCKDKCKSYNDFVNTWKQQLNIQSKQYKDLYYKANGTGNDAQVTSGDKRKVRTVEDSNTIEVFLKNVKTECSDPESGDKYLDKSSNCNEIKFTNSNNNNNDNYAFKNPPKGFEQSCECQAPDPLDQCPEDDTKATYCNKFKKHFLCIKTYTNNLNEWTHIDVQNNDKENKGVLVPPRRRQLCIRNINRNLDSMQNKEHFKTELMKSAYTEAYLLYEKHGKDKEEALDEIYYSFADYGDIVKGTDMLNDKRLNLLKDKLNILLKEDSANEITEQRKKWWTNNKSHIWHAMLCGYKEAGGKIEKEDCELPDDKTPQFLRWLVEWGKVVCKEKKKRKENLEMECKCSESTGKSGYEIINSDNCKSELEEFIRWNMIIKKSLDLFNIKYEKVNKTIEDSAKRSELTVEQYIETEIKIGECNLFDIHEILDIFRNRETHSYKEILKRLCPDLDFTYDITENTETSKDTNTDEATDKTKPATPEVEPAPKSEQPAQPKSEE
ncbi:hypothetical protein PFFCH_04702, partial [Plasmodium falciparum FCH/4]